MYFVVYICLKEAYIAIIAIDKNKMGSVHWSSQSRIKKGKSFI